MEVAYNREKNALSIVEKLSGFRETRQHCDFVVKVGTKEIHVHRNILCANSDYFKAMLSHDTSENQTGCVELKDMDAECVQLCADFMYCRQVVVVDEKREKLLCTADFLQLHDFCDCIATYYEENLDDVNFYPTKKLACTYHCTGLEEKCDVFAVENFEAIAQQDMFKELTKEYVSNLLESNDNKTSEMNKIKALLNWTSFEPNIRKEFLSQMLSGLTLEEIPLAYRRYLLEKEPLISCSIACVKLLCSSLLSHVDGINFKDSSYSGIETNAIAVFDGASRHLQCFSLEANTWTQMHSLLDSVKEDNFSAVCLKDMIYLLLDGKKVYRLKYSEPCARWEAVTSTIKNHGSSPPAIVDDSSLYVIGSWDAAPSTSIEKFDTTSKTWKMLTDKEVPMNCSCAFFGKSIYCIGGGHVGNFSNSVELFDPALSMWSRVAPLLFARAYAAVTVHSGSLYVIGGEDGEASSSMECYCPKTNTWTLLKPMQTRRSSLKAYLNGGRIFAVGLYNQFPMTVESYNIDNDEWEEIGVPKDKQLKYLWSVRLQLNA